MLASILNTFRNCFKIPELKSRILFTVMILAICRLEAYVRVPGLNGAALKAFFDQISTQANSPLGMISMFSGGATENCAIGALTIMPYISATIVMQLLTAVVPSLSKMAREDGGRVKIIKYSRYLTVLICIGQGFLVALGWEHPNKLPGFSTFRADTLVLDAYLGHIWWYRVQTVIILTAASLLLMWLGEQISERGIGNGVSLIITIGIMSRLPRAVRGFQTMFFTSTPLDPNHHNLSFAIALLLLLCAVVAGLIAVVQAQRKIPVQYAQRAVGRKVYSGGQSFLPLRLNFAGVMPIIFAGAILMVPQQVLTYAVGLYPSLNFLKRLAEGLYEGTFLYIAVFSLLILFFSYFWTATQFNELQIADDLKKNGGYIPGVRPGQATSAYLHNAMSRITLAGAIALTLIAGVPIILKRYMHIDYDVAQFFGGTSMLIMVGVLLDTVRQMESHLMMRHYDGFLRAGRGGSRLRGRF